MMHCMYYVNYNHPKLLQHKLSHGSQAQQQQKQTKKKKNLSAKSSKNKTTKKHLDITRSLCVETYKFCKPEI